jgi:hypothetical protein
MALNPTAATPNGTARQEAKPPAKCMSRSDGMVRRAAGCICLRRSGASGNQRVVIYEGDSIEFPERQYSNTELVRLSTFLISLKKSLRCASMVAV